MEKARKPSEFLTARRKAIIEKALERRKKARKVKVQALRPTNFTVEAGELVSIVGPSGSGKSTLMNLIGCLDRPTEGDYLLEGRPVSSLEPDELADIRNKKIGFVFQNFNLLHYATAAENVELPLIFAGESTRRRKERVANLLEEVGLSDRADHRPSELSGGQLQRVAIARSLANEPSILLADEPTGNLDSSNGKHIIDIILGVHARRGTTIVLATHNMELARMSDVTLALKDGRIDRTETATATATATKTVRVTDSVVRRSPFKVRGFLNELIYPAEPSLPSDGAIEAITVTYPDANIDVFGFELHWMIVYFVLSILFAFILRGPFGVTI